jgi:hypothetical protein
MTQGKPGHIVKINSWRTPKANTALVVRTYKAPDDDTILALPSSHPLYYRACKAVRDGQEASLDMQEVYSGSKMFFGGEFKPL